MENVRTIILLQPSRTVFGTGSFEQFISDFESSGRQRLFVVSIPPVLKELSSSFERLRRAGVDILVNQSIAGEPSFTDFEKILAEAKSFRADSVAGIGGGSVLDVAKLVAAQLYNSQPTSEVVGIGNLKERRTYLACVPTTSGTGSEMSPNAIFLNDNGDKIGIISPFLVPDASYIDPLLTVSVPPFITATTGIDALAHCLEAYTNRFAHPIADTIALEGVQLVGRFLKQAVSDGSNREARTHVALGSMYGGMCLGPVNTTAVHALAYPLGADYHLAHGLCIALLLAPVMEFNLQAAPARFAALAIALGALPQASDIETAKEGVRIIQQLIADCGLPASLQEAGVSYDSIDKMAADAMKVQRLLKNNIREITQQDAADIYRYAFTKQQAGKKYSGVVVPMVTPFTEDKKLDPAGVQNLVHHLIQAGTYPFVAGTTGEASSLSKEMKRQLVRQTVKAAEGRSLLYAGIGGNCLEESIEEAKAYYDMGIDVMVATMAYYYPVDRDSMLRYFEELADGLPCPLLLYNIPATTHLSLPIEVVDQLSHHPNIAGFKDSERGVERIEAATSLWRGRSDFSYLLGWAVQSQYALQLGADGLVPSSGNLIPAVYKAILDATLNNHPATAASAQQKGDLVSQGYQKDRLLGPSLAAFKVMLAAYGLCGTQVLPPLYRLDAEEERLLHQRTIAEFGDLNTINSL